MQAVSRIQFVIRTSDGDEVGGVGEAGIAEFIVGRKSVTAVQDGNVFIHDKFMSRRHCRVFWDAERTTWFAQDLDSANGTRLGGTALTEAIALTGGEELRVGTAVVRIGLLDADGETPSATTHEPPNAAETFSDAVVAELGDEGDMARLMLDRGMTQPSARAALGPATSPDDSDDDATVLGGLTAELTQISLASDATVELLLDGSETVYRAVADETVARSVERAPPDHGAALAPDEGSDEATRFAVSVGATQPSLRAKPADAEAVENAGDDRSETSTSTSPDVEDETTSQTPPVAARKEPAMPATAPPRAPTAIASEAAAPLTAASPGARTRDEPAADTAAATGFVQVDAKSNAVDRDVSKVEPPASESATVEHLAGTATGTASTRLSDDIQPLLHLTDDVPPALASNEVVRELLAQQLMDGYQVNELLAEARAEGKTFFRTYVEREDTRQHFPQIYGLVAEMRGLELIDDVDRLYDRSDDAAWLKLELAERMGIVALSDRDEEIVHFASADPFDLTVGDWVAQVTGKRLVVHLAYPTHIDLVLQRLRNRSSAGDEEHSVVSVVDIPAEKEDEIREHLADADAPQIVDYFIHRASMQGASDIHIEPTEERLVIRVRVDGVLHQDVALPAVYHAVVASRLKIMSGMDVAEKRRPQDGRISVVVRGNPIDVRVSTYPTVYGEKIVMRLLDKNALRPSPETLGLLPRDLRVLKDAISAPYGLVMLCGPTGSGKTTTLYSCLGAINKVQQNVLTVEDPVEYRLGGVHQMQVNANIGLTFASGLRTILRQDPDVIMVGECRDPETSSMAIQASLTGHVVFSTIHTNDAVGVVTRLIDMGIEPFLVGSSLSVAIAQRLVRVLCPDCKASVTGEDILAQLAQDGVSKEKLELLHIEVDPYLDYAEARGCRQCRNTGYIGRRAVFEVFEIDRETRALISSPEFTDSKLRALAQRKGMTTLVSHGLKLVEDENTTFAEVIRVLGETN